MQPQGLMVDENPNYESDEIVNAWWESFIKHKHFEDILNGELRSTWEYGTKRCLKFAREVKLVLKLYEPIEKLVNSVLEADRTNRGSVLYNEWGKIRRKECLLAYYDNNTFRATYTKERFLNAATFFLQALVYRIIPDNPKVEIYLKENVSRIISIGVGPGSDIAAYLAYVRSQNLKQRLVFYAVDQCAGWNSYMATFDRHWSAEYCMSVWFKNCRFGKPEDVPMLPDADMLVFSFANTSLMSPKIWPLLQKRYRLIVVLDGIKEILVDGFQDAGFKYCALTEKTNLYYHFDETVSNKPN